MVSLPLSLFLSISIYYVCVALPDLWCYLVFYFDLLFFLSGILYLKCDWKEQQPRLWWWWWWSGGPSLLVASYIICGTVNRCLLVALFVVCRLSWIESRAECSSRAVGPKLEHFFVNVAFHVALRLRCASAHGCVAAKLQQVDSRGWGGRGRSDNDDDDARQRTSPRGNDIGLREFRAIRLYVLLSPVVVVSYNQLVRSICMIELK